MLRTATYDRWMRRVIWYVMMPSIACSLMGVTVPHWTGAHAAAWVGGIGCLGSGLAMSYLVLSSGCF